VIQAILNRMEPSYHFVYNDFVIGRFSPRWRPPPSFRRKWASSARAARLRAQLLGRSATPNGQNGSTCAGSWRRPTRASTGAATTSSAPTSPPSTRSATSASSITTRPACPSPATRATPSRAACARAAFRMPRWQPVVPLAIPASKGSKCRSACAQPCVRWSLQADGYCRFEYSLLSRADSGTCGVVWRHRRKGWMRKVEGRQRAH
jgi:hypothetical protein